MKRMYFLSIKFVNILQKGRAIIAEIVNAPITKPICDGLQPKLSASKGRVGVSISKTINNNALEINKNIKFLVQKDLPLLMFIKTNLPKIELIFSLFELLVKSLKLLLL